MQLDPLDGFQCFQIYQIQIGIEKLALIHVHCFCFPRTRISFFLDEVQGVPGDKVILHPGDDTLAPQNPKIQILIKKLAYKHVHCSWIYIGLGHERPGHKRSGHKRPGHICPPTAEYTSSLD